MNKLLLLATASCAAAVALAAPAQAASVSYALTDLNGSWAWGNTQWNNLDGQGYVDNGAELGAVDAILHAPYAYSAPGTNPGNAIYSWAGSPYGAGSKELIFSVNGGVSTLLDSLTILSSRSYSNFTSITLDYSNDGGLSWTNAVSNTTGGLGWDDVGTAGTATDTIVLNLGGVSANALRFGTSGDQISLHTLAVDGTGAVPEPASWAMMIGGFALAGAAMRRRQAAAVSFA